MPLVSEDAPSSATDKALELFHKGGPTALFDAVRMGEVEPDAAMEALLRARATLPDLLRTELVRIILHIFHNR